MLNRTENTELQRLVLTLINTLVSGPREREARAQLRMEFVQSGMLEQVSVREWTYAPLIPSLLLVEQSDVSILLFSLSSVLVQFLRLHKDAKLRQLAEYFDEDMREDQQQDSYHMLDGVDLMYVLHT